MALPGLNGASDLRCRVAYSELTLPPVIHFVYDVVHNSGVLTLLRIQALAQAICCAISTARQDGSSLFKFVLGIFHAR
jgi:hypothetical protein